MKIKSVLKVLSVGLMALPVSCKELSDTYNEFLEGGEIVYRTKPIHNEAYPGYLRARIEWSLLSPTQVKRCLIFEKDSLLAEIPVQYGDSVRLSCLLEDLTEKMYTLNIYSEDGYGNRSLKTEQFVNIYGPRYTSSLKTKRKINHVSWEQTEDGTLKVSLSPTSRETLFSEIMYRNTEGQAQTVRVAPDANEILLSKVPDSDTLSLRDFSQPDTLCIDTFPAPAVRYSIADLVSQN